MRVIRNFVKEWAANYDKLIAEVKAHSFGCLKQDDIDTMDELLSIGVVLSNVLESYLGHGEKVSHDETLDLTTALKALSILRDSYDSNPSDKELRKMTSISLYG